MFKNLTVGKRIILGFSSMIILLSVVAFFGFKELRKAAFGFTEYREMARDTNLAGQLQANMLMVRMNVKDFLITGSDEDIREYENYFSSTEDFLASAQNDIHDSERAAKVDAIDAAMEDYKDGFQQVISYMEQRDRDVKGVLDVKGPFMEKTLTEIMVSAERDQDVTAAFRCGLAMKHLLLGRLYMAKFLDSNERAAVDRVHQEFASMKQELDTLSGELENPQRRQLLSAVFDARNLYVSAFDSLVTAITERNKIVADTLDRIGPQIAQDAEDVKLSIKKVQDELGPQLVASNQRATVIILIVSTAALAVGIFLMAWITLSITGPIRRIVASLTEGSEQVAAASGQVSAASQSLAEGATEQAAGLEETSSSLEEMSSMTKQNADNAQQANTLSDDATRAAASGNEAMERMNAAIQEIQKSSDETAKIIKVIDEIAFQTNLLALNAAVEAARAGEAGKGFAVVAEEVRNLAMRSAEAAKNTASMIEESVKNAGNGVDIAGEVGKQLQEIVTTVQKTSNLVGEIAAASQEQAQGIDQVNTAVAQMDKVTQQNAANAEESASASEELSAQAESMNEVVAELVALVGGSAERSGRSAGKGRARISGRYKPAPHEFAKPQGLGKSDETFHRIARSGAAKSTESCATQHSIPLDDEDSGLTEFNA